MSLFIPTAPYTCVPIMPVVTKYVYLVFGIGSETSATVQCSAQASSKLERIGQARDKCGLARGTRMRGLQTARGAARSRVVTTLTSTLLTHHWY